MMVLCSKCKRRPAVVFIQTMHGNEKKSEGLCMPCARQMNIPQVKEYMEQMGITDEELEQMSDQMMELMDGDHFEMGGSGTLPPFIQNLLGGNAAQKPEEAGNPRPESNQDHSRSKKKKEKTRELKFLDNYCTNLSKQAEEGKLDNIVGREREIARVIQILSRRQKNNPCLIGEPGVGKTAIAEGIAQKIAAGEVPFNLRGKRVYLMDLTSLVAGTQFRGQFESRVKGLISEVKEQGNIILFIDEVHNLIGTGDSEGSMNAANILKPALSRGEIQVIGATTFSEYRKYIEKDSALERRFQPVTVNVPSIDDTVAVLMGIKKYYEAFHRVKISEYLVRMCAVLSDRYINDRFLPDKAIDLLDESCACASIRHPELGQLDETRKSIAEKETQEKEIEESESPDYQALAEVKADLIRLREQLEQLEKQTANITVSEADLAQVVEVWTGVPASKITQTEFTKLEHLEESLSKRVIGQSEAISVLSRAIKRTRCSFPSAAVLPPSSLSGLPVWARRSW